MPRALDPVVAELLRLVAALAALEGVARPDERQEAPAEGEGLAAVPG